MFRLLFFLPLVSCIYNLDFELCANQKTALFFQERIHHLENVSAIFIKECYQAGARNRRIVVESCTNASYLDLVSRDVFKSKGEFLRVYKQHARLGVCTNETYTVDNTDILRVKSKCSPYEPKSTDAMRFYLVCDSRLFTDPALLVVTSKFMGKSSGHRIDAAFFGWMLGTTVIVIITLVIMVVRSEVKRRSGAASPLKKNLSLENSRETTSQMTQKSMTQSGSTGGSKAATVGSTTGAEKPSK